MLHALLPYAYLLIVMSIAFAFHPSLLQIEELLFALVLILVLLIRTSVVHGCALNIFLDTQYVLHHHPSHLMKMYARHLSYASYKALLQTYVLFLIRVR